MESDVDMPVLIERGCGGWLAVSGETEPVKVGVIADAEAAAVAVFAETIRTWRRNLSSAEHLT